MNFKAIAILALALSIATPVASGPLEDPYAAAARGDYVTAFQIWRQAADQGNADAQTLVGTMYANGRSVPQDYAEALKWHRKAADQGNTLAQTNLGEMLAKGQGVPKDLVSAHMWYNLASARGDMRGEINRRYIEMEMTAAQIAVAQRLAREWKPNK